MNLTLAIANTDRLTSCLLAGAIGDAYGRSYEHTGKPRQDDTRTYYPFGRPSAPRRWQLTDDKQLTLFALVCGQ